MRKKLLNLITLTFLLCLTSCNNRTEYDSEFKLYVSKSDSIFDNSDELNPVLTYFKNGKIIGIEFNSNPECGNYNRKYFIKNDSIIEKIIIRKDFFTEHCEKFDSIYVIEPLIKTIKVYAGKEKGKFIEKENLIDEMLIDINDYKLKMKNNR